MVAGCASSQYSLHGTTTPPLNVVSTHRPPSPPRLDCTSAAVAKRSRVKNVRGTHAAYLETYGLTEAEVPLVWLDPLNWDEPFRLA